MLWYFAIFDSKLIYGKHALFSNRNMCDWQLGNNARFELINFLESNGSTAIHESISKASILSLMQC